MFSFYSPNRAFRTEFMFNGRAIAYHRKRTKQEIKAKVKPFRQTLRGLTKVLPGLLYPTANYDESVAQAKMVKAYTEMTVGSSKDLSPVSMDDGKSAFKMKDRYGGDGQKRGRIVDQHVCALMNGTIIKEKPTYGIHPRLPTLLSKVGGIDATPQKLGHVHPLAQKFLVEMLEKGYRPKAAMVPVGSLELKIGTLMDPMFEDVKTGRLVAVELKVWNPAYYTDGNDIMQPPYEDKVNSPHNQHQLQLGYSVWLFEQTFGYRPASAFVATVYWPTSPDPEEKCVRMFELEPWVLEKDRVDRFVETCTRLCHLIHVTSTKQKERLKLKREMEKRKKLKQKHDGGGGKKRKRSEKSSAAKKTKKKRKLS